MGGAGFSKLYRLDPYYITQPLFTLRGAAEFPSDAEIYLDGRLAGRHSVAPGSFELKNIYSTAGSHLVEVALKDPFGNEQRISYPLYFSAQLLREGLHEYSYNAGFLREQFGVESNEYGKAAFSAFHRYGVTSALNIGARAEGSSGIANAGIFTSFALPRAGAFTLSLAGSEADGNRGAAGSLQHSYQFKSFNTSMFLRGFSRHYATVVAPAATDTARYAASANVGFQVVPAGSFSLAYSAAETHGGARTRVASANYTRVISRTMSVFATASRTKAQETTNSFFLGLNFSFDQNLRGSVQASRSSGTNSETVQLQKDIPVGEGLGYRASLNRSETGASTAYAFNPSLQYNARYGIYSLDSIVQSSDSGTTEAYNISAAGSFVYAGGFYGFSRPVSDSFGIVTIDNVPDAVVLNNGAEMGKTGPSGALVVPSLASYSQNQITLDVKNLPMDYTVSGVNVKISPSIWSGSCVAFDVQKVRAVTGILYVPQKDGQKMPLEYVDILMKAGESEVTIPTGKHGEFYAENILPDGPGTAVVDRQSCRAVAERRKSGGGAIPSGNYHARVHFEGKTCEFTIGFPITDDAITDIGEIQCVVRE
jgi:outer membrane usher protein FimD/PapC